MSATLENLSTEILLKIFIQLNIRDLIRLKQTCKRFNEIINFWGHLFIDCDSLLVTNQIEKQCKGPLLKPFEQLRVSKNWKLAIYKDKSLLHTNKKYLPWLQLDQNYLLLSRGCNIKIYKRSCHFGIDTSHEIASLTPRTRSEIGRFLQKDGLILSGQSDGSLCGWSASTLSNKWLFNVKNHHKSDINSVDLCNGLVVTGSRDDYVNIARTESNVRIINVAAINFGDRVWAVALSPNLLAVGTAGINDNNTLTILDLETQKLTKYRPNMSGAGILDIQWEDCNILWTAGYDALVEKWDLRCGQPVQQFEDPCSSTIYAFRCDKVNTLMTGTQSNGRVVLWDTRCHKKYVQMYFMECCRKRSSPVYALDYDSNCLYAATDQNLSILDFGTFSRAKSRDYSNMFAKTITI